jgi:mRNA-degrading endonuclease HigB of HigAB toxin-antitoxin module
MILIGREHITLYTRQFPSAGTALAMWQAIASRAAWRNQAETTACFPNVNFLTPRMARFYLAGISCVITTQIAFNTGILIVLAVTETESPQIRES